MMLTANSTHILEKCEAYDYTTELTFMPGINLLFFSLSSSLVSLDANTSRLLGSSLPSNIRNALEKEPTTVNLHHFCMRPEVSNRLR